MLLKNKIIKHLLGILVAVIALYLNKVFWTHFTSYFQTIIGLFIPVIGGIYIYICLGVARLKKWAWSVFLVIIIPAVCLEILYIFVVDSKIVFLEGLHYSVFWTSLVVIPIFGVLALIRKISKKSSNKPNSSIF